MAVAFVSVNTNDTTGAQTALTISQSPTAGNGQIVLIGQDRDSGGSTVTSVTNGGDTFTKVVNTAPTIASTGVEIWICTAVGSGRTDVTINNSGANRYGASVVQVSFAGTLTAAANTTATATGSTGQSMTLGGATFVLSVYAQIDQAAAGSAATGTVMANDFMSNQGNVAVTTMRHTGDTTSFNFPGTATWWGAIVSLTDGGGATPVRRRSRRLLGVG